MTYHTPASWHRMFILLTVCLLLNAWMLFTLEASEVEAGGEEAGGSWIDPNDWRQPAKILKLLDRPYSWQAAHEIEGPRNQGFIGWKHATFYTGVMELYRATNNPDYLDFLRNIGAANNWTMLEINGDRWRHADNHLIGETFINLYLEDGAQDPQRIAHVTQIFDRMMAEPWAGRKIYDWSDALFMSPPVWALLAYLYDDVRYLQELDKLWWDATDFLYDPVWDLYYRDKSYFNSLEANGKPVFWGRGNGWVIGGLVRILQYMPEDWPGRSRYVELFQAMAERGLATQMESGGWPASLLFPERFGFETEMSATSFYVYALSWGINYNLLERAVYGPAVEKGWLEMANFLTVEGGIQHIQIVGKEPGPVNDTLTEREYGYGAFILAGVQMANYFTADQTSTWLGYQTIFENGQILVDTADFLGWLEITHEPYVYSFTLQQWLYIKSSPPYPSQGSWIYVFR